MATSNSAADNKDRIAAFLEQHRNKSTPNEGINREDLATLLSGLQEANTQVLKEVAEANKPDNSAVNALAAQVAAMQESQAQIAQALANLTAPKEPQGPDTSALLAGVDPEHLGFLKETPGFADVIATVATNAVKAVAPAQDNSNELAKQVEALRLEAQAARLSAEAPTFRQAETNPAFAAWKAEIDPIFGVPREQLITASLRSGNSVAAENFAKQFLDSQKDPSNPAVAPGSTGADTTPVAENVITLDDINRASIEASRPNGSVTQEEFDALCAQYEKQSVEAGITPH